MSLATTVHTQHNVATLSIGKLDDLIVNQNAIRSESEIKTLIMLLLKLSSICNKFLT